MNITVETTIAPDAINTFYAVYVAAFDPLRTKAAARHVLTAEEFAEEMTDERIEKHVVWDEAGEAVALATLAIDLAAVPWISPEYFAARYPEQFARGAVFYLGYTLVRPNYQRKGTFRLLMEQMAQRCSAIGAVCGFDICAYNDARSVGNRWAAVAEAGVATVEPVDVQSYYAASFSDSPVGANAGDTELTARVAV